MKAELVVSARRYEVDLSRSVDLATPVYFEREGVPDVEARVDDGAVFTEAFHLPRPLQTPVVAGDFVGETRRGGALNCRTLRLTPHGNGTHTESLSHLIDDEVPVADVAPAGLVGAVLLTVAPFALGESGERYGPSGQPDDGVLTERALAIAAGAVDAPEGFWSAIVLRVPGARPASGRWSGQNPPYLTLDAMQWIVERGCEHLLLEVPSVDREEDGGATLAHRVFWNLPEGGRALTRDAAFRRTITEMVQVPIDLEDGPYLLDLQVPPLHTDAAPSRPRLFRVHPLSVPGKGAGGDAPRKP